MRKFVFLRTICAALLLFFTPWLMASTSWDMTPGVTDISQQVHGLHRTIFYICAAIGLFVFGLMFWSILHHRKSKGAVAANFHESTTVEIIWTIVPFIILIAMAVPATKVLVAMYDTSESTLTVRVTGSQWKWNYEYLTYDDDKDVNVSFFSVLSTPREQYERQGKGWLNNTPDFKNHPNYLIEVDKPLVIPTGQKIRFLITADDVIHAWWVPDFAIKRDAVPGFINEVWADVPVGKEGIYRGRCAELCGKDHAFMPIVVEAKSKANFNAWLAEAKVASVEEAKAAAASVDYQFPSVDAAVKEGEAVYLARCAACHQANGTGLPPMFPALKGSKMATEKAHLEDHINIILHGKNAMPAWSGLLTARELAAVTTYERNAWGNDTGDLIQPLEFAK
ncbi:cytochrome c oxidase subunit II [Paraperlucidibaca sp.]|jgi:cytochrome c oxidase subunit 2|uniref:cytochrome c oxidase subunit II n=1 Tax=Paraperlucidibaca sp. TaxID=2708021 RepID=UPI00398A47ED